jgi:hypothetical protein
MTGSSSHVTLRGVHSPSSPPLLPVYSNLNLSRRPNDYVEKLEPGCNEPPAKHPALEIPARNKIEPVMATARLDRE